MEYRKYEFCKSTGCCNFNNNTCDHAGKGSNMCNRTAKEFHKWLKENNFKLVKEEFRAGEKEQLCSCGWKCLNCIIREQEDGTMLHEYRTVPPIDYSDIKFSEEQYAEWRDIAKKQIQGSLSTECSCPQGKPVPNMDLSK